MIFLKNNEFPNTVVTIYLLKVDFNESASWVSAENLWILGRYMVHLPLEEILKISLSEVSRRAHWTYHCQMMSSTKGVNKMQS